MKRCVLRIAFVGALLVPGCNAIFDIRAAKARSDGSCTDGLVIDDMEDGDGFICEQGGRHGSWFTSGDGTSVMLQPAAGQAFTPTMIPGGRGASHWAAHMTGRGFLDWGAAMGFNLNVQGTSIQPDDVSMAGGIKFWLKSNVPILVNFPIPATIPVSEGAGTCSDGPNGRDCGNHFAFPIATPDANQWVEYDVPFSALTQVPAFDENLNALYGSATWNPSKLVGVQFRADMRLVPTPGVMFDVWVDDVRFYDCQGSSCLPTCPDPDAPVACPRVGATPAWCWPAGSDCLTVPVLENDFDGLWGSGPNDVWVVASPGSRPANKVLRWSGAGWTESDGSGSPTALSGVWGSGPNDVWVVGDFGLIRHWNGSSWSATPAAGGSMQPLFAVWGSGARDVWAVGHGTILHWDGSAWSDSSSPTTALLFGVWGAGADDVWAVGFSDVGSTGVIVHWDGLTWSLVPSGEPVPLRDVWGSGPNDIWAVGIGRIVHWNGATWSQDPSPVTNSAQLYDVWGSGANDVWAVGEKGTILHWTGSAWSAVDSGTDLLLVSVWGSSANDVWAGGIAGTILHWTGGTAWSIVPPSSIR